MTLAVSYLDDDAEGYGRMGREIYFAMQRMGVSVTNRPLDRLADTVLFCKLPMMAKKYLDGQRLTLLTMFETTVWPVQFRDMCPFDTVFVPCEANRVAAAEWHDDVRVANLAVDSRWQYRKPVVDGVFRVMSSGSQFRKGLDLTSEAFIKAFGHRDDVELVLKTPHGSQARIPDHPRIRRVAGVLSAADEVALYESANIYVGLSRGEGFGMMPLQAIVQGTPTLVSAGHGHAEYSRFATTVNTSLVSAWSYDMFGFCGDWWESDVDDAVDKLRDMYDRYDHYVAMHAKFARQAKKQFTWENTAATLLDGIGPHGPYRGSGRVVNQKFQDVLIEVTSRIVADIGPHHVDFVPGETYWAPLSVKQALRESGYITDEVWNTTVWRDEEMP